MERDYVKLTRLNEIYREELIDNRRRVRPTSLRSHTFLKDSGHRWGCRSTT